MNISHCFLSLFFTVLMVVHSLFGRFLLALMVDFPLSCVFLWIGTLEQRCTERPQQIEQVATQDAPSMEDRDSLVEFYREGL